MTIIQTNAAPKRVYDALTLGFCADPVLRWLYPSATAYLEHFPETVRLFGGAALEHEAAHCTEDGCAAAMWLPPGVHPDGDGLMALFESVLQPRVLADAYKVFEIIDKVHPVEPCWHLAFIATDPSARGRGLGSALMEQMLPRCDATGQNAYLESTNPANTPFYERHGFRVISEIQAGDSPLLLGMLREPR